MATAEINVIDDISEIGDVPLGPVVAPRIPPTTAEQRPNGFGPGFEAPTAPVGRPRLEQPTPRKQRIGRRSMKEIVDGFLAEVIGHPDANVLGSAIGGRPPENVLFRDVPASSQHMVELRFVYRDAAPQAEAAASSAFEPGGRYYNLVERKGEVQETEPANEGGAEKWGHLVQKRTERGEIRTRPTPEGSRLDRIEAILEKLVAKES